VAQVDRAIFVRETEWETGRPGARETRALAASLTSRDFCILAMLAQHQHLNVNQLAVLFWPDARAAVRNAQIRLKRMTEEWRLLVCWRQREPLAREGWVGWRKRPSIFGLSERGAAVVAADQGLAGSDRKALTDAARNAATYTFRMHHDLEVCDFFVRLAVAARERPGHGLYHWTGANGMRGQLQVETGREDAPAPDGWGRSLTPDREVWFHLEWDRGTESPARLRRKIAGYLNSPGALGSLVLFVAPDAGREGTIRAAVSKVCREARAPAHITGRFWTATVRHLDALGSLGEAWRRVDERDGPRLALPELPGRERGAWRVEASIGRPGWWVGRPAAGEGA